jgi:hypothetical protein
VSLVVDLGDVILYILTLAVGLGDSSLVGNVGIFLTLLIGHSLQD